MRLQRYSMGEYNCYYEDDEEGDVCKSWEVECLEALNAKLGAINAELLEAAEGIVSRWDSPLWKDQPHTGVFIDRLRAAIAKAKGDGV